MIIYEQHPEFIEWAERRIGWELEPFGTLAQEVGGRIEAVVVFENRKFDGCEISFATRSPKWQSRRFIKAVFAYVFNQIGMKRVTLLIMEDNIKSWNLAERLGFTREGVIRRASNGRDLYIYGMLKEECRWIAK